ncbi:immunity protein YezG family protein [Paenibacillus turpanensis]|uniref:immunity protein YezG family protein n=1 Tax=Paenibacillus turpanensis TaxID=2689078 RepID=UPI00140B2DD3|nr:immunity protein YezG family protein [Paenibacillus turpanensis]
MKEFEEKFSELQSDMISICMEYVEDRADKVYVYASREEGVTSSSFFYLINNKYVECHKVNDALENGDERYDVSQDRMFMVLRILNEDIGKIKALCEEYGRDVPTEMKLIYDVNSGKFRAEYQYDLIYTNDDIKTADDIADEWFEEIKNNNL